MKEKLALLCALVHFSLAQDLTLPYFNIAEKKKVTVNATCGEDPTRKDVYCKLAGYDSFLPQTRSDILDGQVNWICITKEIDYLNWIICFSQVCDTCEVPPEDSTTAIPDKAHPALNAVDGDTDTWWQSPPISSGPKYNKVTLAIDLQQVKLKG